MTIKILFICRANQFRSQLAAAYLQFKINSLPNSQDFIIDSAGTWAAPGLPIAMEVRREIEKLKLPEYTNRVSKQIDADLCEKSNLIIVMEQGQKEALSWEFPNIKKKLYLLSEISNNLVYDVEDPVNASVDSQYVIGEIYSLIDTGFDRIVVCAEKNIYI